MTHQTPNRQTVNLLRKLYYTPGGSAAFSGVNRLYDAAKRERKQISRSQVATYLSGQKTYAQHRRVRRNFRRSHIFAPRKNWLWEADLTEVQQLKRSNDNVRYLLVVIDVFSKYAYVRPIRNKLASTVTKAFQSILKAGEKPMNLRTDSGSEFKGGFPALMATYGINHYRTFEGDIKAGVVERMNRTIKEKMYKYMSANNTRRFIDALPALIRGYNEKSVHRSIGMPPADVNQANSVAVWEKLYRSERNDTRKHKPKLKVGQRVLITSEKGAFSRGYTKNWQDEVFTIVARANPYYPYRYHLADGHDEQLLGSFYEDELQVVDPPFAV